MPYFPTSSDIYRVLQRELPEDVYPDGPPSAYFSTADNGAIGEVVGTVYANLSRIYDNYFPASTVESINDWFNTVFGGTELPAAALADQVAQILNKLRSPRGITLADMKAVVRYVVGQSTLFDIIEWNGGSGTSGTGAWRLGYSKLGLDTFLGLANVLAAVGPNLCSLSPSVFGLTQAQWDLMKQQAYTYEVRIYGQTLSALIRAQLDASLSREEPARSGHVITDGLDPSLYIGT